MVDLVTPMDADKDMKLNVRQIELEIPTVFKRMEESDQSNTIQINYSLPLAPKINHANKSTSLRANHR